MSPTSRPRYDLNEVNRLVRSETACIIGPNTISRTKGDYRGAHGTNGEVVAFIRSVVASLRPDNFSHVELLVHSKKTGKPTPADVYGIKNDEGPWYVKFFIANGTNLIITSCHEPERELVCVDGTCVRGSHS